MIEVHLFIQGYWADSEEIQKVQVHIFTTYIIHKNNNIY